MNGFALMLGFPRLPQAKMMLSGSDAAISKRIAAHALKRYDETRNDSSSFNAFGGSVRWVEIVHD